MAAPKMTRHEMKQDDLVTAIEKMRGYVDQNRAKSRNAAIAAAVVIGIVLIGFIFMKSRAAAASEMLHKAQARFGAQVVAQGGQPTAVVPTYGSDEEKDRAALEAFEQVAKSYGGRREGKLARYYIGVLQARLGHAQEAEAAFEAFVSSPTSEVLAGLAKAQLGLIHAQRGDLEGAARIYTELSEDKSVTYPRDWALFYLAQTLDQQGKRTEAAAAYQKVITEFPGSPAAAEASRY